MCSLIALQVVISSDLFFQYGFSAAATTALNFSSESAECWGREYPLLFIINTHETPNNNNRVKFVSSPPPLHRSLLSKCRKIKNYRRNTIKWNFIHFSEFFFIILPPLNFPKMFSFLCALDLLTIELPIYVVSDWEEKKIPSEMWLLPSEEFLSEFLIKLKQWITIRASWQVTMIFTNNISMHCDWHSKMPQSHSPKKENF